MRKMFRCKELEYGSKKYNKVVKSQFRKLAEKQEPKLKTDSVKVLKPD